MSRNYSKEMEDSWLRSSGVNDKEFMKMNNSNGFFASFGVMAILMVTLNVAFWGALIYFAFWCAQHFGLI